MTVKKKYAIQNSKILTINFSGVRFVNRAKLLIPELKKRISVRSRGLTVLLAVEFCLQERVIKDFEAYVNSKRRGLLEG